MVQNAGKNKKRLWTLIIGIVVILVSGIVLYKKQNVQQNNENKIEITDNKPFIVRQNDPQSINRLFDRLEELGANRSSLRFITLVNSDSYYYARDDKNVYWVFINPRKIEGANADSFTILEKYGGGTFGRDQSHIFITGDMVPNVNPDTFYNIGIGYEISPYYRDDKAVFYKEMVNTQTDYRYMLREVVGADPKTIQPSLLLTGIVATDDTHVYMDGKLVPGIDGKTFTTATSSPYAYDIHGTYFFSGFFAGQTPKIIFLDSSSKIQIFTNDFVTGGYVAIGDKMFFGTTTLNGADPETFSVFDAELQRGDGTHTECVSRDYCPYAKDVSSVYYLGKKIADADSKTFTLIGYGLLHNQGKDPGSAQPAFASDDTRVYYQGVIVEGADPKTFTPILSGGYRYEYGKDASYVYWKTKRIENANPKTFKPLDGQQPYEGCGAGRYGTDATGVYYQDKRIEGADLKTFKVIIGDGAYAEDVNHFYKEDKPVDRIEFKECNYG
jgi:hypothetical protein